MANQLKTAPIGQAFFDPALLPWTDILTREYEAIRAEVEAIAQAGMRPLFPAYSEPISAANKKLSWFSLGLVFFTIRNSACLGALPVIGGLINHIPDLLTAAILRLEGNTHLKPHGGYTQEVLRCHFGIIVPEPDACTLRVADEERHWHEREWLVFDDYLEHEVWHKGVLPRYVLLIDVVRPGVSLTAREVAERFFSKAPGVRYDQAELEQTATAEQWREWLEAGEFS